MLSTQKYKELSNKILDNENDRYIEIYQIVNIITKKKYVGQAVSHILNHKKYRPYGMNGRFKCHISEAYSNKKKQSKYLNASIKKYGPTNFKVYLIEYCSINEASEKEFHYINKLNTLSPNGYNLYNGKLKHFHTLQTKKSVSDGVRLYYKDKKLNKYLSLSLSDIDDDFDKYIKPLNRKKEQYGWYIYIKKIKTDFGGVHISLEESYEEAKNFILILKKHLATHLDAGNSLESLTTTSN